MSTSDTIVVTGAAGFIGSYLIGFLNRRGYEKLILVDDFSRADKARNLAGKAFLQKIERDDFLAWWAKHPGVAAYCFHLGARTDTTEMDYAVHERLNLDYSKALWQGCAAQQVPLLYASSAATYGNGDFGYNDEDIAALRQLAPLNPYGRSKHEFDLWALRQDAKPPFWAGVKFFNVYGPNEYHKGRMASVILHAFRQIKATGGMRLFRSHNPAYADGGQMRDFVYVADATEMIFWLLSQQPSSGIYNIGSGTARPFIELSRAVFRAMDLPEQIEYIDTPADIRDKYQYFTEATMNKIRQAGYKRPFTSLGDGVTAYVRDFLQSGSYA